MSKDYVSNELKPSGEVDQSLQVNSKFFMKRDNKGISLQVLQSSVMNRFISGHDTDTYCGFVIFGLLLFFLGEGDSVESS